MLPLFGMFLTGCSSYADKSGFFISQRPLDGQGELKDYDLWYIEKEGLSWSRHINAGENINSSRNEYYISFNRNGGIFFSSNRVNDDHHIYVFRWLDDEFQPAIRLGNPTNSLHYEGAVFVDPDERFLIFSANRPDGFGERDL